MKSKHLFTAILTTLIASALIPTYAFADVVVRESPRTTPNLPTTISTTEIAIIVVIIVVAIAALIFVGFKAHRHLAGQQSIPEPATVATTAEPEPEEAETIELEEAEAIHENTD